MNHRPAYRLVAWNGMSTSPPQESQIFYGVVSVVGSVVDDLVNIDKNLLAERPVKLELDCLCRFLHGIHEQGVFRSEMAGVLIDHPDTAAMVEDAVKACRLSSKGVRHNSKYRLEG